MVPVMSELLRKRRIKRLIREMEGYEIAIRDICSQLIELSPVGDDLHVEVCRLLEALDG